MTVSKLFLEKLEVAREALSHSHPGADAEAILEAGLDLLIERAAKRKGLSTRPSTCAAHNLLAARGVFGDALMDRYAPVRLSPAASP